LFGNIDTPLPYFSGLGGFYLQEKNNLYGKSVVLDDTLLIICKRRSFYPEAKPSTDGLPFRPCIAIRRRKNGDERMDDGRLELVFYWKQQRRKHAR
jgi:hypothetical protein